jgi:hypothetical protein
LFSGYLRRWFVTLDGVWERGGVYSFLLWEILFGLVVLMRLRALTQSRLSDTA